LGRLSKKSVQVRGSLEVFVTSFFFYSEGLLTPRPTPKLEGHPLFSVHGCLFNIFAANLHIWRPFLHQQTRGCAMLWGQEPHVLNTNNKCYIIKQTLISSFKVCSIGAVHVLTKAVHHHVGIIHEVDRLAKL
jgi:hypothetical protein